MDKNKKNVLRNAKSGWVAATTLGTAKAGKFNAVEGLRLNRTSSDRLSSLRSAGTSGDAMRDAIRSSFEKK